MRTFFKGLSYNFKAFDVFSSQKGLWRYVGIPLLLNITIFVILSLVYVQYFYEILDWMASPVAALDVADPSGIGQHLLDLFYLLLRGIFYVLVFALSVVALFVAIYILSALVNAPFYELLSEKVLIARGLREDRPFAWQRFRVEWWRAMKVELYKLLFLTIPMLLLGILSWVPVVGLVMTFFSFVFLSWYFAFGMVSYPMILLEKDFAEIFQFARSNKRLLIGLGIPSLIPIVGVLLVSFQIVGATVLYVEKEHPGDITAQAGL